MTTLTQQFAAEYTKKAVPGMLRAIRINKLANQGILLGAQCLDRRLVVRIDGR